MLVAFPALNVSYDNVAQAVPGFEQAASVPSSKCELARSMLRWEELETHLVLKCLTLVAIGIGRM